MEQKRTFAISMTLIRIARGMSQEQMAQVIHCSVSTLRAYEQGNRTPSLDQAAEISKVLEVPMDWLCGFGKTFGYSKYGQYRYKVLRKPMVKSR